jgi:hypothetical protein
VVKSTRVLHSECKSAFQSSAHRLCGNLGRLICKHLVMKICRESGIFV